MRPRKPMRRGKGLEPGKALKRTAELPRAARSRRPARGTGPSAAVRKLILDREGMHCAACGISVTGIPASVQHRRARRMGGSSDPAANRPGNLVLLCGDGVTGCHGLAESRDPHMHERGFWIYSWESPAAVPVMLADEGDWALTVWLDDSGQYLYARPEGAAA
jgi:hypothetical protein